MEQIRLPPKGYDYRDKRTLDMERLRAICCPPVVILVDVNICVRRRLLIGLVLQQLRRFNAVIRHKILAQVRLAGFEDIVRLKGSNLFAQSRLPMPQGLREVTPAIEQDVLDHTCPFTYP